MGHSRMSPKLDPKPSSSEMPLHWSLCAIWDGPRRREEDGNSRALCRKHMAAFSASELHGGPACMVMSVRRYYIITDRLRDRP